MVDPVTGIDTEQSQLADIVNRQNVGTSQRFRNEEIRRQVQNGTTPDLSTLQSTSQSYNPNTNLIDYSDGIPKNNEKAINTAHQYQEAGWIPGKDFGEYKWIPGDVMGLRGNAMSTDENGQLVFNDKLAGRWRIPGGNIFYGQRYGYKKHMDSSNFLDSIFDIKTLAPLALGAAIGYWDPTSIFSSAAGGTGLTASAGATGLGMEGALGSGLSLGSGLGAGIGGGALGNGLTIGAGGGLAGATSGGGLGSLFSNQFFNTGNKLADSALKNATFNFISSGGDPKAALSGAITGPINSYIGNTMSPYLGTVGSRALGNATSGALSSLFSKNDPIAGSLFGGMSGGLHAYLNSINSNADPFNKVATKVVTSALKKHLFGTR